MIFLGNTYNVNIFGEKLFRLICSSWITSKNRDSVIVLLQRYCESNHTKKDLVGDFLTETLNSCKSSDDFIQYVKLLEVCMTCNFNIHLTLEMQRPTQISKNLMGE